MRWWGLFGGCIKVWCGDGMGFIGCMGFMGWIGVGGEGIGCVGGIFLE